VLSALNYIDNNISYSFTVDDMAKSLHININTLERKFKSELGLSPSKHIKKKRLARATRLLSDGLSVSEVAMQCGFCDCSGFIKDFKKEFGKTPKKYTERFK
jgi:AraC-like DNA-binding protein